MIDDYAQANALVEDMKQHLPFPVLPTKSLLKLIRGKEIKISINDEILVGSVFYSGDEGGIMCGLELPQNTKTALVVSLTHLQVKANHPLAKEIRAYQKKRIKALSKNRW